VKSEDKFYEYQNIFKNLNKMIQNFKILYLQGLMIFLTSVIGWANNKIFKLDLKISNDTVLEKK
jgi:hypothetical protein